MNNAEKLAKIKDVLASKDAKKISVVSEYDEKKKVKDLTTDQRLTRIEKLLGL